MPHHSWAWHHTGKAHTHREYGVNRLRLVVEGRVVSCLCVSVCWGGVGRLGRSRVFWVGLWLLGLGTGGFGLGANWGLGWCLAMRGVQGIGAAAVNVAGREASQ